MSEENAMFEDIDFGDDEFEMEEADFQDVKLDIPDSPYWRVARKPSEMLLRVVAAISKTNLDTISRSILLGSTDNGLTLNSTDKDIYFHGWVPLENNELVLEENIILDSRQMIEVVKNSTEIILYIRNDAPYVNLLGGFYPLETYSFDNKLYQYKGLIPDAECVMKGMELIEELNIISSCLNLSSRNEDKKIIVSNGYAYGMFLTVASRMRTQLPNMTLRARDVDILRNILSLYSKEDISVSVGDDRNHFFCDKFSYSSTKSEGKLSESMVEKFGVETGSIYINGKQIFRVLNFLSSPLMKLTALSMDFSESGLALNTSSRKGEKSTFVISNERFEPEKIDIQLALAKSVFSVAQIQPSMSLSRGEGFILLDSDDLAIVMGVR